MRKKVYLLGLSLFLAAFTVGCSDKAAENEQNEIVAEVDSEEVPISAEEIDEETAFSRFLGLDERQMNASVDPGIYMGFYATDVSKTGDEVSLQQLADMVSTNDAGEDLHNQIYYSYFKSGSRKMLAVNFEAGNDIDLCQIFVFCYYDNTLHLSYNYSCKNKYECGLHKNGYIEASSSVGPMEYVAEKCYIDAAGKYRTIISADQINSELISERIDETIYKKVYKKKGKPEIEVVFLTIGDETFLTYTLADGATLNDKDRNFILKTSEAGFTWIIPEEASAKVNARMEELGMTEKFFDSQDIEWTLMK